MPSVSGTDPHAIIPSRCVVVGGVVAGSVKLLEDVVLTGLVARLIVDNQELNGNKIAVLLDSICLINSFLSTRLPTHPSTNPSVYPSIRLPIHSSTHPSVYPPIRLPTHSSTHPFVYQTHSFISLPTHPFNSHIQPFI